jgi:hypothetical protein
MQLGADFVQLWTGTSSTSGTCGIAYVPGSLTIVPNLLSVVNSVCFTGFTVAHEVRLRESDSTAQHQAPAAGPKAHVDWIK